METRKCKISVGKPGGNASKGAENYRLSIPTIWARDMGLSKEDRKLRISYENKRIIIEKDME